MKIIASYPRSGSTYLRFILCNLYYPETTHTFETVNRLIPTIESDFISEPMDIELNLRDKILEMNKRELKLLGYAS